MKTYRAEPGENIYDAAARIRDIVRYDGSGVAYLIFNDVSLRVDEDSYSGDICEIYRLKRKCGEFYGES